MDLSGETGIREVEGIRDSGGTGMLMGIDAIGSTVKGDFFN
jgi:hypothetical protein